jgi:hypothetical protein
MHPLSAPSEATATEVLLRWSICRLLRWFVPFLRMPKRGEDVMNSFEKLRPEQDIQDPYTRILMFE